MIQIKIKKYFVVSVLYLILGLGMVVFILPFIWMFLSSFKPPSEQLILPPTLLPSNFTLYNYKYLSSIFDIFRVYANSFFITSVTTISVVLLSSLVAYGLVFTEFPGRETLFIIIIATMMIPYQLTFIPLFILVRNMRLMNSFWGVILPVLMSPFSIFLLRQNLKSIPKDYHDAARIDGCSELGILFKIILPLSRAAMAALAILTFMGVWNAYLWPMVILRKPELYTLQIALAGLSREAGVTDIGPMIAGASISAVPVLVVYLLFQQYFIKGMTLTGLKG